MKTCLCSCFKSKEVDSNYIMQLKIRKIQSSDSGIFYCFAQNSFGSFSQAIKLQVRQKPVSFTKFQSFFMIRIDCPN